jgi:hypothetical protein
MIYTNVNIDKAKAERQRIDMDQRFAYEAAMHKAEQDAINGRKAPDVVNPGMAVHEFTYDSDDSVQISKIREARAKGALLPDQIIFHDRDTRDGAGNIIARAGTIERVYNGQHPIAAFAQKIFCIRCTNAQPETLDEATTLHARLAAQTDYRLPVGMKPDDCCCFCGAVLGDTSQAA